MLVLLIERNVDDDDEEEEEEEKDENFVELLALLSSLAFHPVVELFVVAPLSQLVTQPSAVLPLLAPALVALLSPTSAVQTSSLSLPSSVVMMLGDPNMGVAAVRC